MNVLLKGIVWDTDGEKVDLPDSMVVTVEDDLEGYEIDVAAVDAASDKTGWCIQSISGWEHTPRERATYDDLEFEEEGDARSHVRLKSVGFIGNIFGKGREWIAEVASTGESIKRSSKKTAALELVRKWSLASLPYKAEFEAQAWVRDHAVSVDAEGPTEWGLERGELPNPAGDYDSLKTSRYAPAWVADWSGPFEVYVFDAATGEQIDSEEPIEGESANG